MKLFLKEWNEQDNEYPQKEREKPMKPKPHYKPGDKIGGQYLVHKVFMGGMSEVYLSLDIKGFLPFALKTFQLSKIKERRFFDLFYKEATTWIALENHPNIVRCFFVDIVDSLPFMFLEWVSSHEWRGLSLRDWLRYGPLDLRQAIDFIIDICRGLVHVSYKQPGLVHCDLKPENILIAQGRLAKIIDFGLAKVVNYIDISKPSLRYKFNKNQQTQKIGNVVGTPLYMAPEQWRGEGIDVRTDIYAVGCMLYELLTAKFTYFGDTLDDIRIQHEKAPVPTLTKEFPCWVNDLLFYMLAKQKNDRFENVTLLLDQLSQYYIQQFGEKPKDIFYGKTFEAIDYNMRGLSYHKMKYYDKAAEEYNRAINLDPSYILAYINRSSNYNKLKNYNKALTDCNYAINLDPSIAFFYANRGLIYFKMNKFDQAISDFNQAIKLDPHDANTYNLRGNYYTQIQCYKEAIANYNQAVSINNTNSEFYYNRGTVYAALKCYGEALSDFTNAICFNPFFSESYLNRGNIYYTLQKYEEAIQDYSQTIDLDPTQTVAYFNRAQIYDEIELSDKAMSDYTYVIIQNKEPKNINKTDENTSIILTSYINRGLLYGKLKFYNEALKDFTYVINLDPNNTSTYIHRGFIYDIMEKYDLAKKDYIKAIEIDPAISVAFVRLGSLSAIKGNLKEALSYFEKAEALGDSNGANHAAQIRKKIDPDTEEKKTFIQSALEAFEEAETVEEIRLAIEEFSVMVDIDFVTILQQSILNQKSSKSKPFLEKRLKLFLHEVLIHYCRVIDSKPFLSESYINRGVIYYTLQQYNEALKDFTRAIELNPKNAKIYCHRGNTYGMLNCLNEAVEDFTIAIDINNDLADAYFGRGVSYQRVENLDKAIEDYKKALAYNPSNSQAYIGIGSIHANRGEIENALPYFEKAEELGDPIGAKYAIHAREELFKKKSVKTTPLLRISDNILHFIKDFFRVSSLDEMRVLVIEFPFIVESDFITTIEQDFAQHILPEQKTAFEQRLGWLRQIADEQNKKGDITNET